MYLVLKSVPTKECIAHNKLTNITNMGIDNIIHYFQLRIEFTNDYSKFSEHICDCNFRKEKDVFEVYSKPYPSDETNRQIYEKVLKSQFHYSPQNYSFEEYKKNYCKPFELWIRNYDYKCCPKCAVGRGLLHIGENSLSESLEYYKKAHFLILELPNADISTIICDLVTYAKNRMHISWLIISGRAGKSFYHNFTKTC